MCSQNGFGTVRQGNTGVNVTDNFVITAYPALVQGDFTATFTLNGVAATPVYTITNNGRESQDMVAAPSREGLQRNGHTRGE